MDSRIQDNRRVVYVFGCPNQLQNFFNNRPDRLDQTDNIGGNAGFSGNYSFYLQDDWKAHRRLTHTIPLLKYRCTNRATYSGFSGQA